MCAIQPNFVYYATLHTGVPQGTKIGPITFQAVINDAARGSHSLYWKYVDDLTLAENRNQKESSNLQADLDDFLLLSNNNQLKLNPDKCHAMQICFMKNSPPCTDLKIGSTTLSYVHHAKILGIHIQDDLKWDFHVDSICKNAAKRLFMLRKLKRFGLNVKELISIYTCFIRPLLEYTDSIWHSSLTAKQSSMIERIQKRSCRFTLGYKNYTTYNHALNICDLELHCLKFAQSLAKSVRTSGLLPPRRKDCHGRSLRNDDQISQLPARMDRFANSPIPFIIKLLNR